MKKYSTQQKIADLQRIMLYLQTDIEVLWMIYPEAQELTIIKARLRQIKRDLDHNCLHY